MPDFPSYYSGALAQGLITDILEDLKCATFLVASVKPVSAAVAASRESIAWTNQTKSDMRFDLLIPLAHVGGKIWSPNIYFGAGDFIH